jgi:ATP-binding cassette subfamily B multidrug efflux pump
MEKGNPRRVPLTPPSPLRAVVRYAARYRTRYLAGYACLLAGTGLSLAIPWTIKQAIEALERDPATAALGGLVAVIVVLAILNGLVRLGSRFTIIGAAQRVEFDVRNDLYASMQSFSPATIAERGTGDLMARASSDVSAVKQLVGFGGLSLVSTTLAYGGAIGAMLAIDPWLTLWAMSPYPVLILLAKRFNSSVHDRAEAQQAQLGVLSGVVQEHFAGMAVVRAYAMEQRARATFGAANAELLRRSLALGRIEAQFSPLMSLIAGIGILVVLWAGGRAVLEGRITLGALVAFNGYLAYLAWPTIALGWTLSIVRRGLTSMGRIQEIVTAGVVEPRTPRPLTGEPPAIRFEHLTFAYGDRAPVLRDVSFTVPSGETVAVVGPTGSGKSTLGLVLARLWEPPPGTVFLGEHDVRALDLGTLRGSIGFVPQEAFLFSRSILENVTLGRDEVPPPMARRVAATSGVADEVEGFPEGFGTVVGERGLTVSGGQRQRLALARALAGGPPVLVLDDIFASVDAAKEEEIVANLAREAAGRTVLLMTHRLRAARAASRVVVLVEGRVVEQGSHDELVRAGSVYARLWRIQQLEEEIARA